MPGAVAKKSNPIGRPTKYQGNKTLAMVNMCIRRGLTHRGIARALGVHHSTLYDWAEQHPEFSDALSFARDEVIMRAENALLGQAEGRVDGSSGAAIFLLKNLAPHEYQDRRDVNLNVAETVEFEFIDFTGYDEAEDAEFEEMD